MDDIYFSDKPNQNKAKNKPGTDDTITHGQDAFSGDPVQDPRRVAPISCGRVGIGSRAHYARRPRSERRALELLRPDPCRLPSLWIPPSASKLSRSAARHRIQYARRALLYPVQDPRPGKTFSRSSSSMLLLLLLWPFAFRCCSALSLSRCIQSRKVS